MESLLESLLINKNMPPESSDTPNATHAVFILLRPQGSDARFNNRRKPPTRGIPAANIRSSYPRLRNVTQSGGVITKSVTALESWSKSGHKQAATQARMAEAKTGPDQASSSTSLPKENLRGVAKYFVHNIA